MREQRSSMSEKDNNDYICPTGKLLQTNLLKIKVSEFVLFIYLSFIRNHIFSTAS